MIVSWCKRDIRVNTIMISGDQAGIIGHEVSYTAAIYTAAASLHAGKALHS